MARPKHSGTPGKGKHGVPDKGAHKVGRKWEAERKKEEEEKEDPKK